MAKTRVDSNSARSVKPTKFPAPINQTIANARRAGAASVTPKSGGLVGDNKSSPGKMTVKSVTVGKAPKSRTGSVSSTGKMTVNLPTRYKKKKSS